MLTKRLYRRTLFVIINKLLWKSLHNLKSLVMLHFLIISYAETKLFVNYVLERGYIRLSLIFAIFAIITIAKCSKYMEVWVHLNVHLSKLRVSDPMCGAERNRNDASRNDSSLVYLLYLILNIWEYLLKLILLSKRQRYGWRNLYHVHSLCIKQDVRSLNTNHTVFLFWVLETASCHWLMLERPLVCQTYCPIPV